MVRGGVGDPGCGICSGAGLGWGSRGSRLGEGGKIRSGVRDQGLGCLWGWIEMGGVNEGSKAEVLAVRVGCPQGQIERGR